jgi:hypothetical protein
MNVLWQQQGRKVVSILISTQTEYAALVRCVLPEEVFLTEDTMNGLLILIPL